MFQQMLKSLFDNEFRAIVFCDLDHKILYMNKAAKMQYVKQGGADLIGKNLLDCHNDESKVMINKVLDWFKESKDNNVMYINYLDFIKFDLYMMALRDENGELIGYYEKSECREPMLKRYEFK